MERIEPGSAGCEPKTSLYALPPPPSHCLLSSIARSATLISSFQELSGDNSCELLNALNVDGRTPLHIACIEDQPDCVQALLCAGEASHKAL